MSYKASALAYCNCGTENCYGTYGIFFVYFMVQNVLIKFNYSVN